MTELTNYQQRDVAAHMAPDVDPTGGRLVAWAHAATAANALAKSLSQTAFVPSAMKNVGDATAAIIMGDELGLSPLAALRSIYVVHGTPALYARAMVALALSHGHQIWTEETSDAKVVVCGRRRGSEHIERSEWTIQRATKAGYTSNKKYASNAQEMLYSKAAGEVARKVAADTLAGIPYSVEDIELGEQQTTTITREAATAKRTVARKPKAAEPEPEPEPEQVSDTDVVNESDSGEAMTERTRGQLFALFAQKGIIERDHQINGAVAILGREIQSRSEITEAEALLLIETLKHRPDAEASS